MSLKSLDQFNCFKCFFQTSLKLTHQEKGVFCYILRFDVPKNPGENIGNCSFQALKKKGFF